MNNVALSLEGAGRTYKIGNTDTTGSFNLPYKENYLKPKLKFSPSLNSNSFIDEKDIFLLKEYLLGKIELSELQKFSADMNNDGILTTSDLKLMRKFYFAPETYSELSENVKFFIENISENIPLKEIQYIDDFVNFLNIRCVIKGDLTDYKNSSE